MRDHFVYRAFDADGRLLYVGCSKRPRQRLAEHRSAHAEWLDHVARYRLSGPYTFFTARRLERQAIQTEGPGYNYTTPERAAVEKAWQQVYRQQASRLREGGLAYMDAHRAAMALANHAVPEHPETNRDPFWRADA